MGEAEVLRKAGVSITSLLEFRCCYLVGILSENWGVSLFSGFGHTVLVWSIDCPGRPFIKRSDIK